MKKKKWRHQNYDSRSTNEYAWRLYCSNCGEWIYVYIKKGITIKEIKPEVRCENCGVLQSG